MNDEQDTIQARYERLHAALHENTTQDLVADLDALYGAYKRLRAQQDLREYAEINSQQDGESLQAYQDRVMGQERETDGIEG